MTRYGCFDTNCSARHAEKLPLWIRTNVVIRRKTQIIAFIVGFAALLVLFFAVERPKVLSRFDYQPPFFYPKAISRIWKKYNSEAPASSNAFVSDQTFDIGLLDSTRAVPFLDTCFASSWLNEAAQLSLRNHVGRGPLLAAAFFNAKGFLYLIFNKRKVSF